MARYEPRGMELANRDVLSRAMFDEISAGRRLFLDCSGVTAEMFATRLAGFVTLARGLTGIDVTCDRLPVAPAFHYEMGRHCDRYLHGKSGISNLIAAGECALHVLGPRRKPDRCEQLARRRS